MASSLGIRLGEQGPRGGTGPLLAAATIGVLSYPALFGLSMIPAIFAALSVMLLTTEAPRVGAIIHQGLRGMIDLLRTPSRFRSLVAGIGLYGLGNFSATLLILRATQILHGAGRSSTNAASVAILLYAGHNAANAVFAYPSGAIADRIGRRTVLVAGVGFFGLACIAFAAGPTHVPTLALLFCTVGASTAMVETAEGSHASELLPTEIRGRGFGLLGLVDGVGDLVSSVVVGLLWTVTAPLWGFLYAAAFSLLAVVVLLLYRG